MHHDILLPLCFLHVLYLLLFWSDVHSCCISSIFYLYLHKTDLRSFLFVPLLSWVSVPPSRGGPRHRAGVGAPRQRREKGHTSGSGKSPRASWSSLGGSSARLQTPLLWRCIVPILFLMPVCLLFSGKTRCCLTTITGKQKRKGEIERSQRRTTVGKLYGLKQCFCVREKGFKVRAVIGDSSLYAFVWRPTLGSSFVWWWQSVQR